MCAEHEALREALAHASESEARLVRTIEDLELDLRMKRARITELSNQLERQNGEGAEASVIIDIIEYWRVKTGHEKAKVSAAGKRADYVRKALKLKHTAEELKEAIDGAAIYPYVVNKQRSKTGTEKQRYDDLPTVFRDEVQIQRMRKLAQTKVTAPGGNPDPMEVDTLGSSQPIDRVLVAIWKQGWECPEADVWVTSCPTCYRTESLTIRRHEDGMVALECKRGCELWRLLRALGLEASDLWHGARSITAEGPAGHLKTAAGELIAELAKYK